MKPARLRIFARFPGRRSLGNLSAWSLRFVLSLGALGCASPDSWLAHDLSGPSTPATTRGVPNPTPAPDTGVVPVKHETAKPLAEVLSPLQKSSGSNQHHGKRRVPITLDAVFHLAEGQNFLVSQAREKLQETYSDQALADMSWIPELQVGGGYDRHEGGIQDQTGRFIRSSMGAMIVPGLEMLAKLDLRELTYQKLNAERKVWQQQGEVSRLSSETLTEAAATYFDLLAARESESVLLNLEKLEASVLKWAEDLFKQMKNAEVYVESAKAALAARRHATVQVRQQGDAAAAKLAYLLGLGSDVILVPAEAALKPVGMVDASQSVDELVAKALAAGPGIHELEQVLAVIQKGMDSARGPGRFIPTVEMHMIEGAFGAGPGSNMTWDNRWDMCLQFRWNLSDLCKAKEKLNRARSQQMQAELSYSDLKGRLTLGVQESQQAILASLAQIKVNADLLKHAENNHRLSDLRLKERIEGSTVQEVLHAVRILEGAHFNTLNSIRLHNKAQVRLLMLLGAAGKGEPHKK